MEEDKVENGFRPENQDPCYVTCPHCAKTGDYWQTAANTHRNEKTMIACLYCGKWFYVVGMGGRVLKVIEDNSAK